MLLLLKANFLGQVLLLVIPFLMLITLIHNLMVIFINWKYEKSESKEPPELSILFVKHK